MKQIVVIKNSQTKVFVCKNYLIVRTKDAENILGFRYIEKLYLNKLIDISISNVIKLSHIFDVYFIDQYGKILAKVQNL